MRIAQSFSRRRTLPLIFAALSFLGSQVESTLPDVHDGDAVPGTIATTPADIDQTTQGPDGHPAPEPPVHDGQHVDHCAHGHVAPQPSTVIAVAAIERDDLPAGVTLRLVGVDRPPHNRPPIV